MCSEKMLANIKGRHQCSNFIIFAILPRNRETLPISDHPMSLKEQKPHLGMFIYKGKAVGGKEGERDMGRLGHLPLPEKLKERK